MNYTEGQMGIPFQTDSNSLWPFINSLWPFIALQITVLLIVLSFPEVALWLPRLLYG